ncbi:MAG: hypothetical protein ACLURU_03885 [Finegoldia magna]
MKKFLFVLTFCFILVGCSKSNDNLAKLTNEDIDYIKSKFPKYDVMYISEENKVVLYPDSESSDSLKYSLNNGIIGAIKFDPLSDYIPNLFGAGYPYYLTEKSKQKARELSTKGLNDPEARFSFTCRLVKGHKLNFNYDPILIHDFSYMFNISEKDCELLLDYLRSGESPYVKSIDMYADTILNLTQKFSDKYKNELEMKVVVDGEDFIVAKGDYITFNVMDNYRDKYNFDFDEIIQFIQANRIIKENEYELEGIDLEKYSNDYVSFEEALMSGDRNAIFKSITGYDLPESERKDSNQDADGEPMEYIPPEDGMEESDENQKFPYKEGQKLLVVSEKAYNRAEPLLTGKKVGYWIKGDEVTVYDFTYFDDRWWIKTSPDKEWWVSERDLEVID